MNKHDLFDLITSNKKFFVLVFCVIFGVISGESYNILKFPDKPKFRKILPKFIVALFVCFVSTPLIEYFTWLNSKIYYPYYILGISITAMPILDWFINTLIPTVLTTLQSVVIGFISKISKNKKDE